ncbi:hypothetical protein FHL15_008857 [Xylaria flabelliformis]|uniref:Uncharacterized protein n=1 Tax=Xylaria flabelliformis TaxID=2512241 RepID=A0A553HQS4_9PEZI|nr:hypothetical protein FHL15_008857 [Xylaria flabelliformis]
MSSTSNDRKEPNTGPQISIGSNSTLDLTHNREKQPETSDTIEKSNKGDSERSRTAALKNEESSVPVQEREEAESSQRMKRRDLRDKFKELQGPVPFGTASVRRKIGRIGDRNPSPGLDDQKGFNAQNENKREQDVDVSTVPQRRQNESDESRLFELSTHSFDGLPQIDIVIVPDIAEKGRAGTTNRTEKDYRTAVDQDTLNEKQEELRSVNSERHRIEEPEPRPKPTPNQEQGASQVLPTVKVSFDNTIVKMVETGSDDTNNTGHVGRNEVLLRNECSDKDQATQERTERAVPHVPPSPTVKNTKPASLGRNPPYNRGLSSPNEPGVYWLTSHERKLRTHTPNPRVLQFQYPTPQVQTNASLLPEGRLEDHARDLLFHLTQHRKETHYRQVPVVLIGHGFGCIIIERALLKSEKNVGPNMEREKKQESRGFQEQKSEIKERQDEIMNNEPKNEEKMEPLSTSVAGIIFLDAPIQISGLDLRSLNGTRRKRWVTELLEKRQEDTKDLWKRFCHVVEEAAISAVWLLGHEGPQTMPDGLSKEKWPILWNVLKHNRDKAAGENEHVFLRIVDEIKRCLVFKTSAIRQFQTQLKEFVDNQKLQLTVKDHLGRNPLHWAVLTGNVDGVAILANRSKDLVCTGDKQGATPLHVAVQQAAESEDTAAIRENWDNLIRELLKYRFAVHIERVTDKDGKTAWDYASKGDQRWILNIRDERPLKYGATHSSVIRDLKPMEIPKGVRKMACQKYRPILLEIFNEVVKDDVGQSEIRDVFNEGSASIYSLIYEPGGWEKILQRSRPPQLPAKCRWVHIPANNNSFKNKHAESAIPMLKQPDRIEESSHRLVIYLPILAFETHGYRKEYTKAIRSQQTRMTDTDMKKLSRTELLLRGYLHGPPTDKPLRLHPRRTLDQFSYNMLDSTEDRDNSQVVSGWARNYKKMQKDSIPVLMVDQLWLWGLEDGTVITSFPESWSTCKDYDLASAILDRISKSEDRDVIMSVDDLICLIMTTSLDIFQRKGPGNLKVRECFQESINDITNRHTDLFKNFKKATKDLVSKSTSTDEQAEKIDTFFRLDEETELLESILDIQDELNTIRTLLSQQLDALNTFIKRQNNDNGSENTRETKLEKAHETRNASHYHLKGQEATEKQEPRPKPTPKPHLSTSSTISIPLDIVAHNIRVVDGMLAYAGRVNDQKQANAWEARFTREGSEGAKRQGKLPLSFISSFLALGIDKFPKDEASGQNQWPLGVAAAYLYGLSKLFERTSGSRPSKRDSVKRDELTFNIFADANRFRGNRQDLKYDWLNPSFIFANGNTYHTAERGEIDMFTQFEHASIDRDQGSDSESSKDDPDLNGENGQYAPLFGRYMFHVKIWGIRNLWKYRSYTANDDESGYFWDDEIDSDYALHYYAVKAKYWLKNQFVGWQRNKPPASTIPSDSDESLPSGRSRSSIGADYASSNDDLTGLPQWAGVEVENEMAREDEPNGAIDS